MAINNITNIPTMEPLFHMDNSPFTGCYNSVDVTITWMYYDLVNLLMVSYYINLIECIKYCWIFLVIVGVITIYRLLTLVIVDTAIVYHWLYGYYNHWLFIPCWILLHEPNY